MKLASVCPLDCPDTCSLSVTVDDDRVVAVRGSKANPYTAGVLCAKVSKAYPDFVHGANRLTRPLRRVGAKGEGRFEPLSWDDALDIIYEKFSAVIAAYGPQALRHSTTPGPTACSRTAPWICVSSTSWVRACWIACRSAAASGRWRTRACTATCRACLRSRPSAPS